MFKTLNDKSTKLICHKEQAGASKRADKRREKSVAIYFLHEGKNFFQLNFVIHIYMSSWYALLRRIYHIFAFVWSLVHFLVPNHVFRQNFLFGWIENYYCLKIPRHPIERSHMNLPWVSDMNKKVCLCLDLPLTRCD